MANPVYTNVPAEIQSDALAELALDLRWAWNHSTDELWAELQPELWVDTQNPWLVLQSVSHDKLQALLADEHFRQRVNSLLENKRRIEVADAWFQHAHPNTPLKSVAYFSMEYMLSEALPIYSGGLGNVAGDQMKAASDLGVPVIGIGLLYQQGYFRQEIDPSGAQVALYPFNEPGQLPIRPLRGQNGDWLRLKIALPGYTLWIRSWEAQVGRRKLYLLDTNDPANLPAHRAITSELYGGGPELRLRQEQVLGIGGWRLLRALGIQPEVCHLNEGHAAFAVLERALSYMQDHNVPFDVAFNITRAGNLFTTHTPVEAGFDRFAPEMISRFFTMYAEEKLRISIQEFLALGRKNPEDASEPFNMAFLAIRGSGAVNGVSRLHGKVSRGLFRVLFDKWPVADVPVGYVTNGVHVPTWDSEEADDLWTKNCGQQRWRGEMEKVEEKIRAASDQDLWDLRNCGRRNLVHFTRKRLTQSLTYRGASSNLIDLATRIFDENVLILGFARRFATYKRPNMLLHDPERLARLLTNRERPVQLILAGKAHPADGAGQAMIYQWTQFIHRPDVRGHVVFLPDYDMMLTQELVAGVDLWLNTPRRPWEASGTSGMKVLANGGLNLSELDGWWAEAYTPDVGWALGDGREHGNDPAWDDAEADALYSLLEHEIVPEFYTRDENGLPHGWLKKVRESMARLTPQYSANRAVRQYTEEHYIPLSESYCRRAETQGSFGAEVLEWKRTLASQWHNIRFGAVRANTHNGVHQIEVEVMLGPIHPQQICVEIYADPIGDEAPVRSPMTMQGSVPNENGMYEFAGAVSSARPIADYTARVIPWHVGVNVPLEAAEIFWQR